MHALLFAARSASNTLQLASLGAPAGFTYRQGRGWHPNCASYAISLVASPRKSEHTVVVRMIASTNGPVRISIFYRGTKLGTPSLGPACAGKVRGALPVRMVGRIVLHGSEVPFSRMVGRTYTGPRYLFLGRSAGFCDRPFLGRVL